MEEFAPGKVAWFKNVYKSFRIRHDALNYTWGLQQAVGELRPFQSNHKEIKYEHFSEFQRDWKKKNN